MAVSSDFETRPDFPGADVPQVLIVDDEEAVRYIMARVLERGGYRVIEAESGAEAIRIAQEKGSALSLLITDIVMPQMDGWAVAEAVARVVPGISVLFVSGYAGANADAAYSRALGRQRAFLPKPFTASELLNAAQALVATH